MPKYLRGERVRIIAGGCTGEVELVPSPGRPYYGVAVDSNPFGVRQRTVVHLDFDESELEPLNGTVDVLRYGMTPEQLGEGFTAFIRRAYRRIVTVGREYSNGESQQFEDMPVRELVVMALEEAEDLGVYAGMLHIRLQRMLNAIDSAATSGAKEWEGAK
jgi:hypothetical protein